jgi:hypothetical protein
MPPGDGTAMSANFLQDPEFLPFQLDPAGQRVLFVRLDAQQRDDAAFLDQRALSANPEGVWLPLSMLDSQPPSHIAADADAIFHIGHCGSTLLSRLLQIWPEVESLREPLPLRTLAEHWPAPTASASLSRLMPYWRRPLPPRTRVAIKATSSCNGLIEPMLRMNGVRRAILLDMPLEPWLATLLKSEDSLRDATAATDERATVLHTHGIALDAQTRPRDIVEACAMGWLAEQLRFDALARGEYANRVLRIDFEALLASPETVLIRIAKHLQLGQEGVAQALAAPAWTRYSKAQQHDYGREDRDHDLALAKQRFAVRIAAGRAWVERLTQRYPQSFATIEPLRFE